MSSGAQWHSSLRAKCSRGTPCVGCVHPSVLAGPTTLGMLVAGLVSVLVDCEAMPPEVAVGHLIGRVGFLCVWLCDLGWRGSVASLLGEAGSLHGSLCSWGAWGRCWPAGGWGLDPGANRLEGRFQNGALLEPVLS